MDKDAEDKEVQDKILGVNNQQQEVEQDSIRANHKDNRNRWGIFHTLATTVVASDTGPETVPVRRGYEEEDDEVAIVGDVPEAGAGDVRQAMRAWL